MSLWLFIQKQPPDVFCKKGVLRNFAKVTGKCLCQSLFFNKIAGLRPAILSKKGTLAQVLSSKFCEISKNTFSYRTPQGLLLLIEWFFIYFLNASSFICLITFCLFSKCDSSCNR